MDKRSETFAPTMLMIGALACDLMERPAARCVTLEWLDKEHDGFDGVRVVIADVPSYVRGPKRGRPNYKACTDRQTRLISQDELTALAAAWTERTGLCPFCCGEGRQFRGWSRDVGTTYRACPNCNGTGIADGLTISATQKPDLFIPPATSTSGEASDV